MVTVAVREARLNLSRLLKLVEKGEDVLIRNRDRPVARLTNVLAASGQPFPDLTEFREGIRVRRSDTAEALVRKDRDARG